MVSPNRHESSILKCLNCNARGAVTWQAAEEGSARRTLVSVAGDFHMEAGRTTPDGKVIVCTQCDEIYGVLPADRGS